MNRPDFVLIQCDENQLDEALREYKVKFGESYPLLTACRATRIADDAVVKEIRRCISENKPFKNKRDPKNSFSRKMKSVVMRLCSKCKG